MQLTTNEKSRSKERIDRGIGDKCVRICLDCLDIVDRLPSQQRHASESMDCWKSPQPHEWKEEAM